MSDQEGQDHLAGIRRHYEDRAVWSAHWNDVAYLLAEVTRLTQENEQLKARHYDLFDAVNCLTQENERLKAGWQPIATAPESRILLLFAVTDTADDGTVRNWKMATGSWSLDYHGKQKEWTWDGHRLKVYDHQPTHWVPLPAAPSA